MSKVIKSISSKLNFFSYSSRMNNWQFSFLPFVAGLNYFWVLFFDVPLKIQTLFITLLFVCSSIGFASLGFFINELFDIESDERGGKRNRLKNITFNQKCLFLVITFFIIFLPWVYLPSDSWTWILLIAEIILFLAYSMPYVRLKNNPLIAILVDSLYAYVIPTLLSYHTFALFSKQPHSVIILIFLLALLLTGLRNIIIHQVEDIEFDRKAEMVTFPLVFGLKASQESLNYLLFFEFISVGSSLFFFSIEENLIFYIFIFYCFQILFFGWNFIRNYKKSLNTADYFFPNYFLHINLSLISLCLLFQKNNLWLIVLILHFLFLVSNQAKINILHSIYKLILDVLKGFKSTIGFVVNRLIYCGFLLFGIDLIKENKSALEFLRKKYK